MDQFALEARQAAALAAAQAALAQVALLARLWPAWPEFARGPLTARAALAECALMGKAPDPVSLLALGPLPAPNRPAKPLRRSVGLTLAWRRVEAEPGAPLTPSLVTHLFHDLDAPHLARDSPPAPAGGQAEGPVPGAAAWTLAPRLARAGAPPLMALALTCAAWLREAPDHPHARPAGWILAHGLASRLGLNPAGLLGLGPAVARAAAEQGLSLKRVLDEMRASGAWRQWLGLFLRGVEICAQDVLEVSLAARRLSLDHAATIQAWVRAPRLPLQLLELFTARPVLDLPQIAQAMEVTQRTAGLLAKKLKAQGLIAETTGQRRGRRFAYQALLEILWPAPTPA